MSWFVWRLEELWKHTGVKTLLDDALHEMSFTAVNRNTVSLKRGG